MHKYSIKNDEMYGDVLIKDGQETICPFQNPIPIPVQTAMGGVNMSLMRMPCSTKCPLAKISDDIYRIQCGNETQSFKLEEEIEETKENVFKIIR